ncbi:MAG: glycosyltransferase [Halodesulfovibrio sp.]
MDHRPERIRIIHELGKPQSLLCGADQFDTYGSGRDILFLGLGPDIAMAAQAAAALNPLRDAVIRYVESPDFSAQMDPTWKTASPSDWVSVSPEECTQSVLSASSVLAFRQNLRLFPSFWGPLLATVQLQHLRSLTEQSRNADKTAGRTILLPGTEHGLLIRELTSAFEALGYAVQVLDPATITSDLPRLLAQGTPALFFSVNAQGLDMFGERHHLLRAAGVPVAIWCVDTPWHILSGCKAPFWKEALLFVTDASFIPALQAAGAQNVHHLPLATDPALFAPQGDAAPVAPLAPVVFVGRSEFPERRKYFSGIHPDGALQNIAQDMLLRGERPDYHWWAGQLGATDFWPDTPRTVGANATESTECWRTMCLQQAHPCGLTVIGDEGWKHRLPGDTDLRPPVDYYNGLAEIYRNTRISLNITGMLLPAGLTQRHFDVWAAGGLLLTDANPGMDIFPRHLADAVTFRRPAEISSKVNHLLANPHKAAQLKTLWRELILREHTYANRVQTVLSLVQRQPVHS